LGKRVGGTCGFDLPADRIVEVTSPFTIRFYPKKRDDKSVGLYPVPEAGGPRRKRKKNAFLVNSEERGGCSCSPTGNYGHQIDQSGEGRRQNDMRG